MVFIEKRKKNTHEPSLTKHSNRIIQQFYQRNSFFTEQHIEYCAEMSSFIQRHAGTNK